MTPLDPKFSYFWPHREIICKKDKDFNVLFLEIRADGWNVPRVRLWPNFEDSRRWGIFRTQYPSIYCSASSSDCSDLGIQQ